MPARRWWCLYHGSGLTYHLEKGSAEKLCGRVSQQTDWPCRFPVRPELAMDRLVEAVGTHTIDHLLYSTAEKALQGGPCG